MPNMPDKSKGGGIGHKREMTHAEPAHVRTVFRHWNVVDGGFITAALSLGMTTAKPIMLAALGGFLLAVPISWAVARSIVKAVR